MNTAATLGTPSSISLGKSRPSHAATGQPWVTQCEDWYKLSLHDLEEILFATLTRMPVEVSEAEAKKGIETAKHPRWKRLYTDQPMLEVSQYLRANDTEPTS
jgi:hypothetical protein